MMFLYEIINPSDPVTFYAEDNKTAIFVTLIVGPNGAYGLMNCDTDTDLSRNTLMAFLSSDEVEHSLNVSFPKGLLEFLESQKEKVVFALRSMLVAKPEDRKNYELAIKHMGREEAEKYRNEFNDLHRTSLNDIAGRGSDWLNNLSEEKKEAKR